MDVNEMDVDELQRPLGAIVLESAYLEHVLRAAFGALVGSKYVAAVDGRLTASTLIENCHRIAEVHTGIHEPQRTTLLETLRACASANRARNRIIHESWAMRPGNVLLTLHSGSNAHYVAVKARTLHQLRGIADQIAAAADDLVAAVTAALGADCLRVGSQLCEELGRDVRSDLGSEGDFS